MEPFTYVSSGLEAWEAGDHERAERLLREGVDAYRGAEPEGVDFALGRLGAYLLDQERVDDAAQVLDEAITRGTDIPAIWRDYLDIMALRRDLDGLFDIAMRWNTSPHGPEQPWDGLLAHARRADRASDSEFAIAVADRVAASAAQAGDQRAAWLAIGVLGHILERAGQLPKALDLWTVAFAEGSGDPTTANRLSMHRERARDYTGAIAIIEAALDRHLPANTEEQLHGDALHTRGSLDRANTEEQLHGDAYSRPCPYYIASDGERALVSSMGDVYCISPTGITMWHFELPHDASSVGDKESLLATGEDDEEAALTFEFSITIVGREPAVSRLIAGSDGILVGSSDGRLLILSPAGELRDVHVVGESWIHPIVDSKGMPVGGYSDEALFRWERGRFHRIADVGGVPDGVGVWSDGLYAWDRKQLDLLSWTGEMVWSVEFSKNISSAVVDDGRLICAAGVLAGFAPAGAAAD